ncbi:hypothetical protein X797_010645 [Metarhizium robertsii]|uniref:Uncharacterized protein n=2 Tax=Metarhizium robertsii TaxID=568076 RepID=E9FBN3_METRA|nr:uncharacterized protein MAA_09682 [Metarhizium robertsii ARSEF 23]EFY94852.1 hypothetical protein MAA_09682 [Metarhizium robertsii ARSEF 23]EXU96261.1 hypothetical protein X797_010645 [Metarhizium robertsii]
MPSCKSGHSNHNSHKSHKGEEDGDRHGGKSARKSEETETQGDQAETTRIHLSVFIFRGVPDVWYRRHVIMYFTSPDDPGFHKSVHVQRDNERLPWGVTLENGQAHWELDASYLSHVDAGYITVWKGEEMWPLNTVASVQVEGREADWNCQNFVYEGLQAIVYLGLQEEAWYTWVQDEIMNQLLEGAVG